MIKKIPPKIPKAKPKIMFCTTLWLTGGMERKMSNLFKGLLRYYDVFLLYTGEETSEIKIPKKVKRVLLSGKDYIELYADLAFEQIKRYDIDIVIGVMNLFYGQLCLYEKCHQSGIKTIAANSESFFYPYHNQYFHSVIKSRLDILKNVDVSLWQTNFSATAYSLFNQNGYVMPNPNTFPKQAKLAKKDKKIILSIGRFDDSVNIKRVDRILNCFAEVLKKEPEAELWLVGPYNRETKFSQVNKSVNEIMKEQKLNNSQVVFFGKVDSVEQYYREASLLLVTSESEGFSNVVNEAASFGLPIICNETAGMEDLVIDGCNGLFSQQGDIKSLASNVCRVLSDDQLRERLGSQAAKYVEKFDSNKIIKKWKKVIDTIQVSTSSSETKSKLGRGFEYEINDSLKSYSNILQELNDLYCDYLKQYKDIGQKFEKIQSDFTVACNKIDDLNSRYQKVINSTSWKITKPVRGLKILIDKLLK